MRKVRETSSVNEAMTEEELTNAMIRTRHFMNGYDNTMQTSVCGYRLQSYDGCVVTNQFDEVTCGKCRAAVKMIVGAVQVSKTGELETKSRPLKS